VHRLPRANDYPPHPHSRRRATQISLATARDSGSKNITSAGSVTPHGPIIHINDGVDVARTAPPQSSRAQEKGSWLTRIPRQRLEFRSGGHLSSHNPDLRDQDLLLQSCPAVHVCIGTDGKFFLFLRQKIKFDAFCYKYQSSYNAPCILRMSHPTQIYFIFFEACFVVVVADDVEDCLIVVSQIRTVVLVVLLSADT
jgi:hypothetical protein